MIQKTFILTIIYKNIKVLEILYLKFRPPTIDRINLETRDDILKCSK